MAAVARDGGERAQSHAPGYANDACDTCLSDRRSDRRMLAGILPELGMGKGVE
jgi:hypothetical protein